MTTQRAAVTPVNTDAQVCGDLEQLGGTFYTETFAPLLTQDQNNVSMNVVPIELSAQLAVLTTIGAATGEISGAEAIANSSPTVRAPMITMVQDADRLAERFAATSLSGVLASSDVTAILTSFAKALVACTQAGYQPSYFDPIALTN
ncbi:hypothetical protein ACVGOW_04590 [Pseudonocardia saturnea]